MNLREKSSFNAAQDINSNVFAALNIGKTDIGKTDIEKLTTRRIIGYPWQTMQATPTPATGQSPIEQPSCFTPTATPHAKLINAFGLVNAAIQHLQRWKTLEKFSAAKSNIAWAEFRRALDAALDDAPLSPLLIGELRPLLGFDEAATAIAWLLRDTLRMRIANSEYTPTRNAAMVAIERGAANIGADACATIIEASQLEGGPKLSEQNVRDLGSCHKALSLVVTLCDGVTS